MNAASAANPPVSFSIPKFAQSPLRMLSNFGIGTPAATSIRRGLAAAHGHELFLTKSENEPCGLVETVCELSVVRIHHLSSFRLRRRSQRRDDLRTRHA